jgi:sec-independent protein translocase protein TatA
LETWGQEEKMFGLGMPELLVIFAIILIIFGAGRLPEIGSGIGKGIRNFLRATKGQDEIDITPSQKGTGENLHNEESSKKPSD